MEGKAVAAGGIAILISWVEGWPALMGWILLAAAAAVLAFQRRIIQGLRKELKEERAARELLEGRVSEMKTRIDKQQQELMVGATERLQLSREVESLSKTVAILNKTVETNMAALSRLSEKYGDL